MSEIILKEESYQLIGTCMEVHPELGMGFKEIVYKDALEYEFKTKNIPYFREKQFKSATKKLYSHINITLIL
ncbi:MAG: GxxExxY protein [Ferruginibacter sp.]|nr:GxxExxY protein [Ferruginibacter sp.]